MLWWNEFYTGNVVRADLREGTREVRFHAAPIKDPVERGLLGLALDPNITANGVFYVYYTVADPQRPQGGTNRLARVAGDAETVLLTTPAYVLHNGGRILVHPDGSLFVSTGENDLGAPAQDPASVLGKILRLWPDGRPAADNLEGYVYDLGHRNVYGLAFDPATRQLFATENNNAERDEVNVILAGRNYGWPTCEGTRYYDPVKARATNRACDDARFTPPIGEFYPDTTAAPTGAAIFRGALYWASWNEGAIHRMSRDPVTLAWRDEIVFRPGGRIHDLEAGPDGRSMYYSNWTAIIRIELPPGDETQYSLAGPVPGPPANVEPSAHGSPGLASWIVLGMWLAVLAGLWRRRR